MDHAQLRTAEFIELVVSEMTAMGIELKDELFVEMAPRIWPIFTTLEEHFEFREQLAGCFSSAAYNYLIRKWHTNTLETKAVLE